MEKQRAQSMGYLPDEKPPFYKLILYAIQQVIVMFPATVTVALITKFDIATTIFASGLATLCFLLITKKQLPLYYGSSFSYISAITGLAAAQGLELGSVEAIRISQFGIVMSGLVSIVAGLIVNHFGRESIEKVLPPTITGSIAMTIGLTLAANAIGDACTAPAVEGVSDQTLQNLAWVLSLLTLFTTILCNVYLKGFIGQLTLIIGPAVGVLAAFIIKWTTGIDFFRSLNETSALFAVPHFTLPKPSLAAVAAIMPIAIATIPESTAHVFQLDVYVNNLAQKKGSKKKYDIGSKLGLNLIGDGLGDMISGFVGGPAGTNYGENISTMTITNVFSVSVLIAAAVIAMVISFFTPLTKAIYAIPTAVIGGLEIFLFGAIAAQGIAIMIDRKVSLFESKNIAVIAAIMIIGIGGNYKFEGGAIPFFGMKVPCIAGAAIFGIFLNLILSIGKKKPETEKADSAEQK